MKKRTFVVLAAVLSLSLITAVSAFARRGGGYGQVGSGYDRGHGNCYFSGSDRTQADPETLARFQKETLPFRDEMVTKRLELRQEYDKENPDADRIAQLRKDMIDIETKIHKSADKFDIWPGGHGRHTRGGFGRGCF